MTIQPFPTGSQGIPTQGTQPRQASAVGAGPVASDEMRAEATLQARIGLDGGKDAFEGSLAAPVTAEPETLPSPADRALSEMSSSELQDLFGDQAGAMKELSRLRPDLKGSQLLALQGRGEDLENLAVLLDSRPDLGFDDLVKVGEDGKAHLDPCVRDEASRDLLSVRTDLNPSDLAQMKARFRAELGDAGQADQAHAKALALLEERSGLKPEEVSGLSLAPTIVNAGNKLPAFAEKPISEMTEEELSRLFGHQAPKMKELGALRPGVTGVQAKPLAKDDAELDSLLELFKRRTDIEWDDVVKVGLDGKTRVDPSATDDTSRELLCVRPDLKPLELTKMAASFAEELRDPALAETARRKALALLKERTDVKPAELTQLMQTLVRGQNGNAGMSAAAALDMFDSSARLLTTRRDLGVADADKMAHSVLGMAGKKDSQSGLRSAQAFSEAVDTLIVRQDMGAEGITQLCQTMNQRFPGQDEGSSADRHSAFSKGLSLLRQVPGMEPSTIGTMMQKGAEGPPPRQGIRLLQAFDTMSQGVLSGRANMELMRDPLARPDPEGKKKRDGEIVLDKHGNEKTDLPEGPKLSAHQAPQGSHARPETPASGERSGAPGTEGQRQAPEGQEGVAEDPLAPQARPQDRPRPA